jgi:hypothetical protein
LLHRSCFEVATWMKGEKLIPPSAVTTSVDIKIRGLLAQRKEPITSSVNIRQVR